MAEAEKRSKHGVSLPDEIINEILLRLPARSILRFRAVCRLWAAHLSSPAFTEAYAAAAKGRTSQVVVVLFAASPGRRSTTAYSCSSQGAPDALFTVDHMRTDSLFLSSTSWPSRGLMLLSDTRTAGGGNYWVCNPSTGECRALPHQRYWGLMLSSAGLVVDDRTKQCKVVHLFFKWSVFGGFGFEVYTLGEAGRRWRPPIAGLGSLEAKTKNVMRALRTEEAVTKMPPVAADGFLHWLIYPSGDGPPQRRDDILRFSAADERFDFISAPCCIGLEEDDVWLEDYVVPAVPFHLAELHGSLCMVHDLRRRRGHVGRGSIDVWVLRCGDWSLDYRIAVTPLLGRDVHSPRFITVLGCYGGGGTSSGNKVLAKSLLIATSEHKVFAYSPDSGDVETVFSAEETGIGLQKEAASGLRLGMYEDSLVRIGGEESHDEKRLSSAVREILLRLPLKSIARSMLVCKEWCVLIESESFVASHMSMERPTSILMATNGRARRAFFAFAPLESWLDQASPAHVGSAVDAKIICSKPCNGLNLISTSSDDYLCNPCTGAIQCLGIRGRSRFSPWRRSHQPGCHPFSIGRNIGFGFDRSTGEHVAVEIGDLGGTLACLLKTSESDAWTCVGTPPMPVTDMPPAHVDGTLYWVGAQAHAMAPTSSSQQRIVVVAFDISTRAFSVSAYEQRFLMRNIDHDAFLVELNKKLSLVVMDRDAEEVEIWTMHERGAWVDARRLCLRDQPDFSPRTTMVVVPLEARRQDGRILLNTGRALGYYDTMTGAIDTLYSLNHLQFPLSNLAFPMLCQESLVRVPDEMDLPAASPPASSDHSGGLRSCGHPEHDNAYNERSGTPRPIFQNCQKAGGCQGSGEIYSTCCKRVICRVCIRRCPEHSCQREHVPLNNLYAGVIEGIQRHGLPMEHPFVPDPDYYCYYYSSVDVGDVVRHVFVSMKDFAQGKEACHLTECAYRMDGHGAVRETWVRRYLKIDFGGEPLT